MNNEQFQNVVAAKTGMLHGIPGSREIYNALWDEFHTDPDFDYAIDQAESEE